MSEAVLCRECRDGKCVNCAGWSLNDADELDACSHVEGGMHL